MSTTMFIPMPEWQAILFLRDRQAAFERLLSAEDEKMPGELVPAQDGLKGFRSRNDAIVFGYQVYPEGFAMVRFVVHPLLHSGMVLRRQFVGASDADAPGSHLYRVTPEGLLQLRDRMGGNEVEVMVDQIFTPCVSQTCVTEKQCSHDGGCLHQIKLDAPAPEDQGRPVDKTSAFDPRILFGTCRSGM